MSDGGFPLDEMNDDFAAKWPRDYFTTNLYSILHE